MGDRQQMAQAAQAQMAQQQDLPPNIQAMQGGFGLTPEYIAQLQQLSRPGGMFSASPTGSTGIIGSFGENPELVALRQQVEQAKAWQQPQMEYRPGFGMVPVSQVAPGSAILR